MFKPESAESLPIPVSSATPSLIDGPELPVDVEVALESLNQWQLAVKRFMRHRMALIGLAMFCFIVLVAIIGPIVAPYNPIDIPGAVHQGGDGPSFTHPMGTDDAGRDVYTMVVNGAHISLAVGFFATLIAGIIGIIVGSISGAAGGFVDNLLMRLVDVTFAVPLLFLILVAAVFFGQGSMVALILIFGILQWGLIARLVRAQFLSLREADFVEAARAVGVGTMRITFRHILPNALGPVIVVMTLLMASNIVLEAFVSFLNFGIAATEPTWGNALSNAQNAMGDGNWWWAFFPGMAIALTVISINFVGDGLHDALDPRARL
jgi:peptide/nickel transport system permease protein/oligopeptide transport system permease protein